MKNSNTLLWVIIVILAALVGYFFANQKSSSSGAQVSNSPIPSVSNTTSQAPTPVTTKTPDTTDKTLPIITSYSPTSGPIGTVITLKGKNLPGFESDLDAWIENSAGQTAYLAGIPSSPANYNQIVVKIDSKICTQNNSYSGKPCESYMTITPGVYKIYTAPWGKKSNVVTFTVTSAK